MRSPGKDSIRTGIEIKDQEIDIGRQTSNFRNNFTKTSNRKLENNDSDYFDNLRPGKIEKPPIPIDDEDNFLVIDRDEYMKERKIFSFPNQPRKRSFLLNERATPQGSSKKEEDEM